MFETVRRLLKKFRTIKKIDDLSSMERLGRDEYKFIEGDHALTVQVEMLSGVPRRVIYERTIKNWLPPHDHEIISEEKRKEILKKICTYFEINDISYIVQ
jgi:immunity protein 74 of polymorphic toxin system